MSTSSNGTRPDPRIQKSKLFMSTAMMQLLEKNSFSQITVNDICSIALVSRTTFYQHFQDKYELLEFCLHQMGESLLQKSENNSQAIIYNLLEYVSEKRKLFSNLFEDSGNKELIRLLGDTAINSMKEELEDKAKTPEGMPLEAAAVFLSGGVASILIWWVETDFAMPKEMLAEHLQQCFASALEYQNDQT